MKANRVKKMRTIMAMLAIIVLASCEAPELSTNKQAASDLQELHRTLWLVTATPRVGQVVRLKVKIDATAGIANSTNAMADLIVKLAGLIEKKPDLDRPVNLNSTTGVNVAITLLRFAGNIADSSISADADATRTARFSFKQVIVEQPTALDLLQQQVQKLDFNTPPDAADWWAISIGKRLSTQKIPPWCGSIMWSTACIT